MATIRVSFAGDSWLLDDLTLDEFAVIEDEVDVTWVRFNPLVSSKQARAVLTAFLARSIGHEEAARKIGVLSIKEAAACFEVVREDLPEVYEEGLPKEEAGPSTAGSSGPPETSDGPPT